jgi:hypothetical protein
MACRSKRTKRGRAAREGVTMGTSQTDSADPRSATHHLAMRWAASDMVYGNKVAAKFPGRKGLP